MRTKIALGLGFGLALVLGLLWVSGGLVWLQHELFAAQKAAQSSMAGAIRGMKAGRPGAWGGLLAVCFGYGFLHAAGPGHGKMVIGGYGMAERVRLWSLVGLAFASSMAQALVAVLLVLGGVWLLGWGRDQLEWASGAVLAPVGTWAIIGLGLWILARGALRIWRMGATKHGHHDHDHDHDHHDHAHGPSVEDVQAVKGWRDAAILIGAIAIRPCTGALFVLIITQSMGLWAAGIAGAFAMGLGTAMVTALVAGVTVWAREGALVNLPGAGLAKALPVVEVVAGVVIVVAAALLLGRGA